MGTCATSRSRDKYAVAFSRGVSIICNRRDKVKGILVNLVINDRLTFCIVSQRNKLVVFRSSLTCKILRACDSDDHFVDAAI